MHNGDFPLKNSSSQNFIKYTNLLCKFIHCLRNTQWIDIHTYMGVRRDRAKSILNLRTIPKQTVSFILQLLAVETTFSTHCARGYVHCTVSLGMKAKTKICTCDQNFGHYQLSQIKYPHLEMPPSSAELWFTGYSQSISTLYSSLQTDG